MTVSASAAASAAAANGGGTVPNSVPNEPPKRAVTCLGDLAGIPPLPKEVTNVPGEVLEKYPHTKRVGNYLLGKTLGEGSFAKVREGLHTVTGEKVAIKVIDKKRAKEDSYVHKNLRREGRILQLVRHPCIIQLYDILETENSYYLVMELCSGGDMMEYLKIRKSLPEKETRKYVRQIISAVDHLHRAGILHRDLKVENLLLDEKKNMKLIDFGLSRNFKLEENGRLGDFQQATQCGSPAYAAPELLGKNKYGPKVDVWSIGVNMYAMLTGGLPFTAEPFSIKVLYQKMMNFEINPIPDHITQGCIDLLKKLMNPDPTERISLEEAMNNDWINEGYKQTLSPAPFPNKIKAESLNRSVLKFMEDRLQINTTQAVKILLQNQSCSVFSAYNLLIRRLHSHLGRAGNLAAEGAFTAGIRRIEPPDLKGVNKQKTTQGNNSVINVDHDDELAKAQALGIATTERKVLFDPKTQMNQFHRENTVIGNTTTVTEKPQSSLRYPGMHTDRRAMERQANKTSGGSDFKPPESVQPAHPGLERSKTTPFNKPPCRNYFDKNRPITGKIRNDSSPNGINSSRRPASLNRPTTNQTKISYPSSEDNELGDIRGRAFDNTFRPVGILKRVTQPRVTMSKDVPGTSPETSPQINKKTIGGGGILTFPAGINNNNVPNGSPVKNGPKLMGKERPGSSITDSPQIGKARGNTANIYKWNPLGNQKNKKDSAADTDTTLPAINSPKLNKNLTLVSDRPKTSV